MSPESWLHAIQVHTWKLVPHSPSSLIAALFIKILKKYCDSLGR